MYTNLQLLFTNNINNIYIDVERDKGKQIQNEKKESTVEKDILK